MSMLTDEKSRTDLLNRLKRAEGQLRGVQRMLEAGESCMDISNQMAAVRKALDSTYVRMITCFMQQEFERQLADRETKGDSLEPLMRDVQALLGKVR